MTIEDPPELSDPPSDPPSDPSEAAGKGGGSKVEKRRGAIVEMRDVAFSLAGLGFLG